MHVKDHTALLAERLYEAYCKAVGGVAFNNDPLPAWKDFRADPRKTKQADAWVVVAFEAEDALLKN